MSPLTAVLIDDEPLALEGLAGLLAETGRIRVTGTARDGLSGLALVERLRPDVVFLDISMPGLDGLAVAARLTADDGPDVVLVTAHDHFATEAFDLAVRDYLLKPVDGDRLSRTLSRLESVRSARPDGFWAPWRGGVVWTPLQEVVRLEAEGDYVRLVSPGRAVLVRATLSDLEQRLAGRGFVRLHRSLIVATASIVRLRHTGSGAWSAVLEDGEERSIGRSRLEAVRKVMEGQPAQPG